MDLSRDTTLDGAESKDPEGAYLAPAVSSLLTTEACTQFLFSSPEKDRGGSISVGFGG
jgi:hypothetical protein